MSDRFLILAPRGRDSEIIAQVLRGDGAKCVVCADAGALRGALEQDVGGIMITEEAAGEVLLEPVLQWIETQPPWSDLPIIVLATRQTGPRPSSSAKVLERLGNVVLLERPLNGETLVSAARSAIRARRRQYQVRALVEDQVARETQLRQLNETLEERVQARTRELQAAGDTLSFALDSAGMGSWDLDLCSDRARCSPQHDSIFGYTAPVAGWGRERFLSHVAPEDRSAAMGAFGNAPEIGRLDLECRIRRTDGVLRWIAIKGRVDYDRLDRPARMAGIVMDITDRRTTEDALHQAQKMEAIGQLTGGVAHDFNNLLTVIVGGLDLVIRKPEQTERVVRLAKAAMTAARRGEQLTQQLLAFSRRQMLRPQTVRPDILLGEFRSLAQRATGDAIVLAMDFPPPIDPIHVDPAQFEAAVLNLVVNARDAMNGRGTIIIGCRNIELTASMLAQREISPGGYVEVSVADDGSGIDEKTLARAFEPFFTTKDVGKGSGLGLSQVYGFMRSAGGDASISSTPGLGTTVRLCFPRALNAVIDEPSPGLRSGFGQEPLRPASEGETVLLVEDDEQVLDMAIESLRELHYSVVVSRNASEALSHLSSGERIDVLFSDVVMPGEMNGAQLALEARRLRPELKVLLTSGYVGEHGAGQLIGSEMPVLNKPLPAR